MDYMAQGVIGGNLINHRLKLGFIHIPKCGGCSVTRYLHKLSNDWESLDPNEKAYAAEPFTDYNDYQLFTTVRHPVTWILSGYKFMKQRYGVEGCFDTHLDRILHNTYNDLDWRWHCSILPSMHIGNFSPKVFKLEEISKLELWANTRFSCDAKIESENATEKEDITVSNQHLEKIKIIASKYANEYNYKL